jgi:cardiolipin synthase
LITVSSIALGTIPLFVLVVYWVAVIVMMIAMDRDPSITIAWILVLCLIPGLGLVLYYFTGRNWSEISKKSKWHKARQSIRIPYMSGIYEKYKEQAQEFLDSEHSVQQEHLVRTIWNQTGTPPLPARDVEYWTAGADYFPVLLDDLRNAKKYIHMQYFTWEDDELARSIADVLIERLKCGVEVRILNDFFGSITYSKKDLKRVRAAGGTVLSDVTALNKINYRNHRKITVVDGVIAHTGGFNIGQEYIDGGDRYEMWRDTGLRFKGPAVLKMQDLFAQRWFEVEHQSLWVEEFFPVDKVGQGDTLLQVAAQGVEDVWHSATSSYEVAISRANEYVWLQSPYYVPTPDLEEALINAAFAGIDVRLMITGHPDKKIAWDAAFTYFKPLIESGVKVYLYEAGFLHAKAIVTDDLAVAIGTMNLDTRSLLLHKELVVWMYDRELATSYKEVFLNDLLSCRRITIDELNAIKPLRRFRNSAYRLTSRLL